METGGFPPSYVLRLNAGKGSKLVNSDWKLAAQNAAERAADPAGLNGVGAARTWTIKARAREAKLPQEGRIRYIPPEGHPASIELPHKNINGRKCYIDKFKNVWKPGPSRTQGQPFEWDVQLSDSGKQQFKWLIGNKDYLNISLDGRITHL